MYQNELCKKKSLKKVKTSDIGLSEETPLSINEGLCSYYERLWNKCKKNCATKNYQWQCQVHFKRRWWSIHCHSQKYFQMLIVSKSM